MISRSDICGREWLLQRTESHEIIGLHEDGSLSGVRFAHVEHEWDYSDGNLTIKNFRGNTVYSFSLDENSEEISFTGKQHHKNELLDCTLKIRNDSRNKTHYRERGWDRLLTEQRIGSSRDFLLVKFNSLGKPFSGILGNWEMYHLPNELSVDYLRFSASGLPRSWYLDKIDVIMAQLRAMVAMGYKRFAMIGMSAGGYAAIASAELLAAEFPELEITSISFNPTLLVSDQHYKKLMEFPAEIRSTLCTPDNYKRRQIENADIPDVIQQQGSAKHFLHYDRLNPFEAHQVSHMPANERVTIIPHDLNVNHGAGTIAIYKTGLIHEQLRSLMPDDLYPPISEVAARKP